MKHHAEYLMPGSFFPEQTSRRLSRRSVKDALKQAPENAYCFVLYDTEEAPDLGADFTVIPRRKNISGRYYIGGEIYYLAAIEAMGEDKAVLASNMRANNWSRVICCRTGNWQPFEKGDVMVRAK